MVHFCYDEPRNRGRNKWKTILLEKLMKKLKHPSRNVTFSKAALLKATFPMVVFHIFKIVQIVPNWTKHLICFKYERPFREEND